LRTCPLTLDQFKKYRYAVNTANDGQQKKEAVYKLEDELPDCVRYKLMAYPRLPDPKVASMTKEQRDRWEAFNERTRYDIERMRDFHKQESGNERDLQPVDANYPVGDFFGSQNYYSY
jgi:hypothetical protein